jgi:NADPH:quinone reductase
LPHAFPRQTDKLEAVPGHPIPEPGPGEVLIHVAAAGVNRADVQQSKGLYPPPAGASPILGLEVAGQVTALGPNVHRWRQRDEVCALVNGGGYSEYCIAPEPQCLPIPEGFSMVEAAAIPETFFTVWTNVFDRGRLKAGERILIHGGSSGIGTTAIQLAKAFGAFVIVTAGSHSKCEACLSLGADQAINYHELDFVEAAGSVNLILDMIGGPYFERNLKCLALDGRLVHIAAMQGRHVDLDLAHLMRRRITITGSTLRPRSGEEKGAIARALETNVWPLLSSGRVKPLIYRTFPLQDFEAAHALMESGEHIGKIVLTVGSSPRPQP